MNSGGSGPLERALGLGDAIAVGLGAMLGAGIFAGIAPAVAVAREAVLISLVLAAVVALCNGSSSAQLAAAHPLSGGTYVYARERLNLLLGFAAGWAFLTAKVASCAALAATVAAYALPGEQAVLVRRGVAVGVVTALTVVNLAGIRSTARVTKVLVAVVLLSLAAVCVAFGAATPAATREQELSRSGVAHGAALLFFAFAGYARVATLAEEVRDPARIIPRAVVVSVALAFGIYAVVLWSALRAVGAEEVARTTEPLRHALVVLGMQRVAPLAQIGAVVASLVVLLSLLAGLARTAFSMARDGELPQSLVAVDPRRRVPHVAQVTVGAVVALVAATTDLRNAIAFSAFAILFYYAITNLAALRLARGERRFPRSFAWVGLAGCVLLASSLPASTIVAAAALLVAGIAGRAAVGRR